ncbi:hypothetical protein [Streptomyces sp. NPDC001948]
MGAALGGFLLDRTSAPAILVGCGAVMILTVPIGAVVLKLCGSRRRRHQPSQAPAARTRRTD